MYVINTGGSQAGAVARGCAAAGGRGQQVHRQVRFHHRSHSKVLRVNESIVVYTYVYICIDNLLDCICYAHTHHNMFDGYTYIKTHLSLKQAIN